MDRYQQERTRRRIEEVTVGDIQIECIFNLDGTVGEITIYKDNIPEEIVNIYDEDGNCEVKEALRIAMTGGREVKGMSFSEMMGWGQGNGEVDDEVAPF